MEWWLIFLVLLGLYFAYSAGHWVGYGKGERDTRELTEEIIKLNKKRNRYDRWARRPLSYRTRNIRQELKPNAKYNIKAKNHWWETDSYKAPSKRVPARQPMYLKSFDDK